MAEADASGLLNPGQKKMLANIAHYEKQAATTADFVAGQLAAGVYEDTLPEELRIAGYQGCVYELAQQLLKEIAQDRRLAGTLKRACCLTKKGDKERT